MNKKKLYLSEQKRFKELEEENKKFKDKPILNEKTIEICNNINKNKKPIYLKTKEILENKEKNLENQFSLYNINNFNDLF